MACVINPHDMVRSVIVTGGNQFSKLFFGGIVGEFHSVKIEL